MNKKLAFSFAASTLLGAATLATAAPDCSSIGITGRISVAMPPPQPRFPLVNIFASVNVPKKTVCYDLAGNGLEGPLATAVSPNQLCVNLAHPATNEKVVVMVTTATGQTRDVSSQFDVATSQKVYAKAKQICSAQASKTTTDFPMSPASPAYRSISYKHTL